MWESHANGVRSVTFFRMQLDVGQYSHATTEFIYNPRTPPKAFRKRMNSRGDDIPEKGGVVWGQSALRPSPNGKPRPHLPAPSKRDSCDR